jgi:hypothetical protein
VWVGGELLASNRQTKINDFELEQRKFRRWKMNFHLLSGGEFSPSDFMEIVRRLTAVTQQKAKVEISAFTLNRRVFIDDSAGGKIGKLHGHLVRDMKNHFDVVFASFLETPRDRFTRKSENPPPAT